MIKELQYKGYATEPSDYECPDGQLSASLNLINEDNQLKPVLPPAVLAVIPDDYKIVYIHSNNSFCHYILLDTIDNTLYWLDKDNIQDVSQKGELHQFKSTEIIYSVNSIGNSLVVLTANGMHYLLWKNATDGYLYLGTHLPELPISFGLRGDVVRTEDEEKFDISFDGINEADLYKEFSDKNKTNISNQVLAKVNKFIADYSTNAGKFIYPFLVRYAYRLYDGSLTMHSAPVLMVCSSDLAPQVFYEHITGENGIATAATGLRVVAVQHTLDYAVIDDIDQNRIKLLRKWGDIVRSVDIFISKPIYTYDQNGQCTRFTLSENIDSFCICLHNNQAKTYSEATYPLYYQVKSLNQLYALTFSADFSYPAGRLMIPRRSTDQVKADIRACSQFYLLKSIPLDELSTERLAVAVEEDYLQSLVTREVMTDDFDSHDQLIPLYSFSYNSRLNIANLKKRLYDGFNAGAMFCYTNGYVTYPTVQPDIDGTDGWNIMFFIKQDGRDIIVAGESFQMSKLARLLFFYYPNVNAYKAVFYRSEPGFGSAYEVPLEAHAFLNGAFYFGGWENATKTAESQPSASTPAQRTIDIPNKIYTSEVNNPFHFPVLGINTVGTGTILGISAAAKAMSQGQFGHFPLYAFTTEGVWALEVSSTGSYTARQPITRDVCINPDSITQIDSSVLFATDRGIMLIAGSTTKCISDDIFAEAPFNVLTLPGIDRLLSRVGNFSGDSLPSQSFLGFLRQCRMLYDYVHQRIYVFNPAADDGSAIYPYAYVYSLKSNMWGMALCGLASALNAYPDAQAITRDGELVSFSGTGTECAGLYITRPLKLDAPDVLKTISGLIQRGHFQRGDVATVLYGSRDLYSWHIIWSSADHYLRGFRGTPYKYFRIAGIAADLADGKSIFGASINFEHRHTNQLR